MKKWKKVLVFLICLLFVQAPAVHLTAPVQAAARTKTGLVKENGKYYFYNSNGAKVKSKWKSVKAANGKTYRYYFSSDGSALTGTRTAPLLKKIGGKYYAFNSQGRAITNAWKSIKDKNGKASRYYFDENGAAYMGSTVSGAVIPNVVKIGAKQYAFGADAKMVTGVWVIPEKDPDKPDGYDLSKAQFYAFNFSNGAYNAKVSSSLNAVAVTGAHASILQARLSPYAGKPKKETQGESCFGDGTDVLWTYSNFQVSVFHPRNGQAEQVQGVSPKYNY